MHSRNRYAADSQHAHRQRMENQKVPHAMIERAKERHRIGQEVAARLQGRKTSFEDAWDAYFYNRMAQTVFRAKSRTSCR